MKNWGFWLCCNKHLPSSAISAAPSGQRNALLFFAALFAILLASRLCHTGILWADEDYHQAAALQALHGKVLYRDLWYDKPPLNVAVYMLFGARGGVILRFASALYAWLVCTAAGSFAKYLWTRREGYFAAALAAFFLIFYFPAATITLEPDTLMLLPHLGAVSLAWKRRPFAAGIVAGLAMLLNVKGAFVAVACALAIVFGADLIPASVGALAWLVLGFLIPNAAGFAWLISQGALAGYLQQVWRWGFLYAGASASAGTGWARLGNWTAFHAALVLGLAIFLARGLWDSPGLASAQEPPTTGLLPESRRILWMLIAWTFVSLAGAAAGWRFAPRYLDQLLPPLIIGASRGFSAALQRKSRMLEAALALALLVPLIRFGPRYAILAWETIRGQAHDWTDTAMDRDSRQAAEVISKIASRDATLFVWGYRPNIFVYSRLTAASRFWDSQPLTGVPADRHLADDRTILRNQDADWAARNRAELTRSHPDFIADGLSLYNPRLDIHRYPDLAAWLAGYCEVGRTSGTILYRRCDSR